ncbi:MAG: hypothetical protein K6C08_16105 [Oscillospiraceae bacterium]|nr:hypothetical protein [Oscillospiraceae bacterium]
MQVRAKHWLNIDGTWHRSGETFQLPADTAERLRGSVTVLDRPKAEEPKPAAVPVKAEEAPKTEEAPKAKPEQKKSTARQRKPGSK